MYLGVVFKPIAGVTCHLVLKYSPSLLFFEKNILTPSED